MMRTAGFCVATVALAATALAANSAAAQTELVIRDAAARVVVVPQDRSDIQIEVTQPASSLPRLTQRREGDRLILDGGLGRNVNCRGGRDRPTEVSGRFGTVSIDQAPRIIARVPRNVRVSGGPAVFGDIGRSASVELNAAGCGDWTVANTSGGLDVNSAGSGEVRAGSAASAEVNIGGSGTVRMQAVSGPLTAAIGGSGDVHAASVNGPVRTRIAGSGDVRVNGGQASELRVDIAGSGDVRFAGRAERVEANIVGSGDVRVLQAGSVSRRVMGSGNVVVGRVD